MILKCSRAIIEITLKSLRDAGENEREGIVLWLADRANPQIIVEAYVPPHVAEADRFWISSEGMTKMMNHLRSTQRSVSAQVHSHPEHAFHSWVDDEYAIPQHVGALSIVVPFFARHSTAIAFQYSSAFFVLSPKGEWQPVAPSDVARHFESLR